MTKEQLAAENARLREENEGLRDLLAAVSECAGTVPVANSANYREEWQRATHVLAFIKGLSDLDDWTGYLAYAAGELRSIAAEDPGYEVYAPAGAAPVITDSERDCRELNPAGGWPCHRGGGHAEHRDSNGETWTTAGLFVAAKAVAPVWVCPQCGCEYEEKPEGDTCGTCGQRWDGGPGKCLDKYEHIGRTDYCQRDKGHDGQHAGHMNTRWNQVPAQAAS